MSKKIFTNEEIMKLKNNKYVNSVSEKGITYTDEFKSIFIADRSNGKLPRQIFEDCGFDIEVLGQERIKSASKRWQKAYRESGELGLRDTRKTNSGRPVKHELTHENLLAKKDAEIEYLKSEVELLKKIELRERQVKNNKLPSNVIFLIIQNINEKYGAAFMWSSWCIEIRVL